MYAVDSRDEVVGGVVSKQSVESFGEQGWRSDDCTRLPPMSPGLDSSPVPYVGSVLYVVVLALPQGFFSGSPVFLPP